MSWALYNKDDFLTHFPEGVSQVSTTSSAVTVLPSEAVDTWLIPITGYNGVGADEDSHDTCIDLSENSYTVEDSYGNELYDFHTSSGANYATFGTSTCEIDTCSFCGNGTDMVELYVTLDNQTLLFTNCTFYDVCFDVSGTGGATLYGYQGIAFRNCTFERCTFKSCSVNLQFFKCAFTDFNNSKITSSNYSQAYFTTHTTLTCTQCHFNTDSAAYPIFNLMGFNKSHTFNNCACHGVNCTQSFITSYTECTGCTFSFISCLNENAISTFLTDSDSYDVSSTDNTIVNTTPYSGAFFIHIGSDCVVAQNSYINSNGMFKVMSAQYANVHGWKTETSTYAKTTYDYVVIEPPTDMTPSYNNGTSITDISGLNIPVPSVVPSLKMCFFGNAKNGYYAIQYSSGMVDLVNADYYTSTDANAFLPTSETSSGTSPTYIANCNTLATVSLNGNFRQLTFDVTYSHIYSTCYYGNSALKLSDDTYLVGYFIDESGNPINISGDTANTRGHYITTPSAQCTLILPPVPEDAVSFVQLDYKSRSVYSASHFILYSTVSEGITDTDYSSLRFTRYTYHEGIYDLTNYVQEPAAKVPTSLTGSCSASTALLDENDELITDLLACLSDITVHYSDGSSLILGSAYYEDLLLSYDPEEQYDEDDISSPYGVLTVSYIVDGVTLSTRFSVEANWDTVISYTLSDTPATSCWLNGTYIIPSITATLNWSSGRTSTVECTVTSNVNTTVAGTYTVQVRIPNDTQGAFIESYTVTVSAPAVVSISLTSTYNLDYVAWTALHSTNILIGLLTASVTYEDGTTTSVRADTLTNTCTFDTDYTEMYVVYNCLPLNQYTVTITHDAEIVTVTHISATKTRLNYVRGIDSCVGYNDITVTAYYSNGTSETVSGWTYITNVDITQDGVYTIIITYEGLTTSIAISVSSNTFIPIISDVPYLMGRKLWIERKHFPHYEHIGTPLG